MRVERAIVRMTQAELAEKVGVCRQTINAIESEKYVPSTVLSLKICSIFGRSLNDVFQLEDSDWIK
ncbi:MULTISPECIES: helix-turn-helix transcriptional regulator [Prevotella]|nr:MULTISPECIES: helix-turn-helix transcriptional regulator [Prevotella]